MSTPFKESSGFGVMAEPCDQCLFSKNKIVSNERRREILETCKRQDRHFICHKATLQGKSVCCRAFYDRDPAATNGMRIAGRLNAVLFVDEEMNVVEDRVASGKGGK